MQTLPQGTSWARLSIILIGRFLITKPASSPKLIFGLLAYALLDWDVGETSLTQGYKMVVGSTPRMDFNNHIIESHSTSITLAMESADDLFSPEALRLLDQYCNQPLPGLQPDQFLPDLQPDQPLPDLQPDQLFLAMQQSTPPLEDEMSKALTATLTQRKHKSRKPDSSVDIPGCSVLGISTEGPSQSRRSRFGPEKRQKVASVRGAGACLRCRVLKISVCRREVSPGGATSD